MNLKNLELSQQGSKQIYMRQKKKENSLIRGKKLQQTVFWKKSLFSREKIENSRLKFKNWIAYYNLRSLAKISKRVQQIMCLMPGVSTYHRDIWNAMSLILSLTSLMIQSVNIMRNTQFIALITKQIDKTLYGGTSFLSLWRIMPLRSHLRFQKV